MNELECTPDCCTCGRSVAVLFFALRAVASHGDDELTPAHEFLNRVVQSIDVNVDDAYRTLQIAGQKAYKEELEKDRAFWDDCDARWGAKRTVPGGKYRDEISDLSDGRFESGYAASHKFLKEMVQKEWGRLVGVLDAMLKEQGSEVGAAVKRK